MDKKYRVTYKATGMFGGSFESDPKTYEKAIEMIERLKADPSCYDIELHEVTK